MLRKFNLLTFFFILAITLLIPTQLLAQGRPSSLPSPRGQQATISAQDLQRSCEARQNAIKKRSEQLLQRANKMLDTFGQISDRAQEFYDNKIIPTGKTVPNYNELLSEIALKSTDVAVALDNAKQSATNFDCSTVNPKEQLRVFNKDAKEVVSALKIYRTSVRDLIVAIHSTTGDQNSNNTPATNSANINRGAKNR